MIAFVMIFLWVPETKQRTLEELDYVCTHPPYSSSVFQYRARLPNIHARTVAVPTRTHMAYQFTKALPYFFRRYVFRDKSARLEPLYHFDAPVAEDLKKAVEKP